MRFSVSKPLIVLTAATLGLQTWIIFLPLVLEDMSGWVSRICAMASCFRHLNGFGVWFSAGGRC